MSPNHDYYIVTGDPLQSLIKKYQDICEKSLKDRIKLSEEFQTNGDCWGSYDGISALGFDHGKVPKGWIKYKKAGFYKPSSKTEEGKALIERLRSIPVPGHLLFQQVITGDGCPFRFMLEDLTGMRLGFETIGEHMLFAYPVPPEGKKFSYGEKTWKMPTEGVRKLTKAEHLRMLADFEETKEVSKS